MRTVITAVSYFIFLTASAYAQESPMTCRLQPKNGLMTIYCDIRENGTIIDDIVLNRGNCKSPKQVHEEMKIQWQRMGMGGLSSMLDIFGKKFQFGDSFEAYSTQCNNILEYSITANGRAWTWKTR